MNSMTSELQKLLALQRESSKHAMVVIGPWSSSSSTLTKQEEYRCGVGSPVMN